MAKAVEASPDATNLRFHGHALKLLGAREEDPSRRRELLERALTAFEKSQAIRSSALTAKEVGLLRKALKE
jgi:hypothetical protein